MIRKLAGWEWGLPWVTPGWGGRCPCCPLPGPWRHMQCLSSPHPPAWAWAPLPRHPLTACPWSTPPGARGPLRPGTPAPPRHQPGPAPPGRPQLQARKVGLGTRRGGWDTAQTCKPHPCRVPGVHLPFSHMLPGKLPQAPGCSRPHPGSLGSLHCCLAAGDVIVLTWVTDHVTV